MVQGFGSGSTDLWEALGESGESKGQTHWPGSEMLPVIISQARFPGDSRRVGVSIANN